MQTLRIPFLPMLDALAEGPELSAAIVQRGAQAVIGCVNWPSTFPFKPLAAVIAAHSETAIYLHFSCKSDVVRATHTEPQSAVSQDSCVEFFVQPRPGGEYWNFEFNCIGAINASRRMERPSPTRLTPEELEQVRRIPSLGDKPFGEREMSEPWTLTVVIPLSLIGAEYSGQPVAMRGNFYACASASSQPYYLSWNAIYSPKPNFHLPAFFGDIILE